jgi:hypothetical protein
VREEDAGGREAGAPSDLKMPLENGAGERASSMCVCGGICREGGTLSSAAGRRRVPSRRPPPPAPRHNGRSVRSGTREEPGTLTQDAFGNRTQNSRVAGARPNHQADRGSDPNHRGIWSPPMDAGVSRNFSKFFVLTVTRNARGQGGKGKEWV